MQIAVDPGRTPHADFQLSALQRLSARRSQQADRPISASCWALPATTTSPCSSRTSRSATSATSPSLPLSSRPTETTPRTPTDEEEEFEERDKRRPADLSAAAGRHRQCLVDRRTAERRRYRRPRPAHHRDPSQGPRPGGKPHGAAGRRRRAVAGRAQAAAGRRRDQGSAGQHRDALPAGRPQRHGALDGRPAPDRRRDRRRGRLKHIAAMRTFSFVTVDVFTDRRFGGNPLAVFPDAQGPLAMARCSRSRRNSISARRPSSCRRPNPANTRARPHLQPHRRDAVRRPSQCRHRLGAGRHGPRPRRPVALRGDRRPGRGPASMARASSPSPRRSRCRWGRKCRPICVAGCVGIDAERRRRLRAPAGRGIGRQFLRHRRGHAPPR